MTIKYSYSDYTTKGHGVIEGSWGGKKYNQNLIEAQKVGSLPSDVKIVQSSKNYFDLKIPDRSANGPIMKVIKTKIDSGQTIRINAQTFIRKNKFKEYELLKKSKSKTAENISIKGPNSGHRVDEVYNHLMKIHKAAKRK